MNGLWSSRFWVPIRTYASDTDTDTKKEQRQFVKLIGDDEVDVQTAEPAKRDVSRLKPHFREKMYHREEEPSFRGYPGQLSRAYKREVYARMGAKSGVDPSLFYPFQDELDEMIEERNLYEPPLEQLKASAQAKVDEEERERKERWVLCLPPLHTHTRNRKQPEKVTRRWNCKGLGCFPMHVGTPCFVFSVAWSGDIPNLVYETPFAVW